MVDLKELRSAIKKLSHNPYGKKLYFVLRDELTMLGYWRRKPRGNPRKGGLVAQSRKRQRHE